MCVCVVVSVRYEGDLLSEIGSLPGASRMSSGIQIRGRVAWRGRLPLRSLAAVAVHELEVEEAIRALGRFSEDVVWCLGLPK